MSDQPKGPICRQTYFNQGSYLRARDNEKQICNVITEIENGTIIPYIVSHGGEIDGNLTVKGNLTVTGNLNVNGNLSYAGNISLGNSCSDIITVGGTSTFTCPATFSDVDINGGTIDGTTIGGTTAGTGNFTSLSTPILSVSQTGGVGADQPSITIQSQSGSTTAPTFAIGSGGTPVLIGSSSNTCGSFSCTNLAHLDTITVEFGTTAPVLPAIQITVESISIISHLVHLTGLTSVGFTITNNTTLDYTGTIHYFVVDLGA